MGMVYLKCLNRELSMEPSLILNLKNVCGCSKLLVVISMLLIGGVKNLFDLDPSSLLIKKSLFVLLLKNYSFLYISTIHLKCIKTHDFLYTIIFKIEIITNGLDHLNKPSIL